MDLPSDVVVSDDGSMAFITGMTGYGGEGMPDFFNAATLAIDGRTGRRLWTKVDEDTRFTERQPPVMALAPSGDTLYVVSAVGTAYTHCGCRRGASVSAYDAATGDRRWETHLPFRDFYPGDVVPTEDGSMVVATGAGGDLHSPSFLTVALNAQGGDAVWTKTYRGRKDAEERPLDIELSRDETIAFVSGTSSTWRSNETRVEIATVAYATDTGNELWRESFSTGPPRVEHIPIRLVASRDGRQIFIVGRINYSPGHVSASDVVLLGYDALTGQRTSVKRYEVAPYTGDFDGHSVAVTDDLCNAFVGTSKTQGRSLNDYVLLGYEMAQCE
jgi:outer membrane protein assembly factor BamB